MISRGRLAPVHEKGDGPVYLYDLPKIMLVQVEPESTESHGFDKIHRA
jgi:hypothetical protein